jgi:hypothetical protein
MGLKNKPFDKRSKAISKGKSKTPVILYRRTRFTPPGAKYFNFGRFSFSHQPTNN